MVALDHLHIQFKMQSLSTVTPNATIAFNYFTTYTTMDLTDVSDLVTQINNKIAAIPSGGVNPASNYIHAVMSRGANQLLIDVYDVSTVLSGGRMGSPVLVTSKSLGTVTGTAVCPHEAAAVITLQAPYGSDVEFGPGTRPRARDRGRLYWGPLSQNALSVEATTNRTYISSQARTDLTAFIKSIVVLTSSPHTVVWNLGVWSRKNAVMKSLQEAWVDDNPDTQRRRGGTAVNKTVIALP